MKHTPDQTAINALVQKLRPKQAPKNAQSNRHTTASADGGKVLEKLFGESEGQKWRDIYNGSWSTYYDSQSSADAAILHKLAFWTDRDSVQMEDIMRGSGLARKKWDTRRGGSTWLADEIDRAIDNTPDGYNWQGTRSGSPNTPNSANTTNGTNSTNRPVLKSARDLMAEDLPPTKWAVRGLIPEGVSLLAGKPKQGKSWMALDLCITIAEGSKAFGTIKTERGETAYLALEDNKRRMQTRIKKVLNGRECPEGFGYETSWLRLEEGGAEALDELLEDNPDIRLVVIDTLVKIRKPARGQNVYAEDYAALEKLLPLAAKHGVAIVVVHHLRKGEATDAQDEISGSTGLSGGVDGYLILRRKPGAQGPTLYVDGRDIEEPQEYALHWNMNSATWSIEGTAEEVHISKERADILLTLNRNPEPMTPKEVADAMPGKTRNNIRYLLWAMFNDGQILKDKSGAYYPANTTNSASGPKADTYQENGDPVSAVSAVSGDREEVPLSFGLEPGESATLQDLKDRQSHKRDCLCVECTT